MLLQQCRGCNQEGLTGLPAHTINPEKEKALTRVSGGWQPDLNPLGSVICMERGTSLPYLNGAVRFMGGNRSSSSRPPSLMIGGSNATVYLRNKVTHCCSSSLLKLCLNMHFTQEVQSTKAKGSMALDDNTTTFLLGLALPHFCLPPDRGTAWGAGGSLSKSGSRPVQGFLDCHRYHICSSSALSA